MPKSKPSKHLQNRPHKVAAQERTRDDWDILPIAMLKGDKARFERFAERKRLAVSTIGRNILLEAMDREAAA